MGKQNQYECSMRMPLILAGRGIKPGKRVDEMVYQHSARRVSVPRPQRELGDSMDIDHPHHST
jgi:hypothetical protein